MTKTNQFQAQAFEVPTNKHGFKTVRRFSRYPLIPSTYPNRAVRRLVAQGRLDLLPTEWRQWTTQLTFPRH